MQSIQNDSLKSLFLVVRKYEDVLRTYVTKKLNNKYASHESLVAILEKERDIIQREIDQSEITGDRQTKLEYIKDLLQKKRIESIYNGAYSGIRFFDILMVVHVFGSLFENYQKYITKDLYYFYFLLNQTKQIRNSFSHEQLDELWIQIRNGTDLNIDFDKYDISLPTVAVVNFVQRSLQYLEVDLSESLESYITECSNLISFLTSSLTLNNLYEVEDQFKQKLIMRDNELNKHLIKYILDGHRCSYVILGMGGVGKSRLAYEFTQKAATADKFNFIFWISSKDEEIKFDKSIGYKVNNIKANFSTVEEFIQRFCNFKGIDKTINSLEELYSIFVDFQESGLFIIDNFDNLDESVREAILKFIDKIQEHSILRNSYKFILTSREDSAPNEIEGDVKLNRFEDDEGLLFVNEFCKRNNIESSLTEEQIRNLVRESVGVTLILVVAIEAIYNKTMTYERIISILSDSSSSAIKELGEYFFRESIDLLVRNDEKVKDILLTLHYFEGAELIDISRLTKIPLKELELSYLPVLTSRYAVRIINNGYALNDFAIHYVHYRFIIGYEQEVGLLHKRIIAYNTEMDGLLRDYENTPDNVKLIIREWKPRNKAEEIATYKAYFKFIELKNYMNSRKRISFESVHKKISEEFSVIYDIQTTPYVIFQHAAILSELLSISSNTELKKSLQKEIIDLYEYSRSLSLSNRALLKEKSYPSMLFKYGMFHKMKTKEVSRAMVLFKESFSTMKVIGLTSEFVYFQICFNAMDTIVGMVEKGLELTEQIIYDFKQYYRQFEDFTCSSKSKYRLFLEMKSTAKVFYYYVLSYTNGNINNYKLLGEVYGNYLQEPYKIKYFVRNSLKDSIKKAINIQRVTN